jgi:hypothetical protein
MAFTIEKVKKAFQDAAEKAFEHIPPEDEIDCPFSPEYCARRDSLIELVGKMQGITDTEERGRILDEWEREMDRKKSF